jgi:hypothetical protein
MAQLKPWNWVSAMYNWTGVYKGSRTSDMAAWTVEDTPTEGVIRRLLRERYADVWRSGRPA